MAVILLVAILTQISRGIIPRAVEHIFDKIESGASQNESGNVEFRVSVSYVEIYMENIRDLLDRTNKKVEHPFVRWTNFTLSDFLSTCRIIWIFEWTCSEVYILMGLQKK